MKSFNKLIVLFFFVTISNIALSNTSDNKNHFKNLKKVSLKCDILYMGGVRDIHYHYGLPIKLRGTFEADLLNIPSKNKIYRVNQCVEIDKKFNDEIANKLDEESKTQG
ncbi:hypothetical protein [Colwellia sp. UCD-KL20]|uniref:hypothetical protein n=1 Tax=Colwellia sp. UCD-KL20 TaxID=1917165 RepID=UPI000970A763|nr:hypothetical protein [Colwellia sp. UCD-KL20]